MRRLLLLIALFGLLALPTAAAAAPNVVGQVEEFPLGPGTRPEAIVAGPDGNLWFAGEQYLSGGSFADVVGKVTPGGKVTEFQVDTHSANLGLSDIAVGPDGNLWFTEGGAAQNRPDHHRGGSHRVRTPLCGRQAGLDRRRP